MTRRMRQRAAQRQACKLFATKAQVWRYDFMIKGYVSRREAFLGAASLSLLAAACSRSLALASSSRSTSVGASTACSRRACCAVVCGARAARRSTSPRRRLSARFFAGEHTEHTRTTAHAVEQPMPLFRRQLLHERGRAEQVAEWRQAARCCRHVACTHRAPPPSTRLRSLMLETSNITWIVLIHFKCRARVL